MGPALAMKAVAPKYFSFLVFGVTQVVIDSEAAVHLLRGDWPYHRFLHTYLGATLVALLTVVIGRPMLEYALMLWNRLAARGQDSVLRIGPRIPLVAAISGALVGGYSHVLLDGIIYTDVRPFAPWSEVNVMLHLLSTGQVYLLCMALGVFGGVAVAIMYIRRRRAQPASHQG